MSYTFNAEDVKKIIEHWLYTPSNGYIGVNYGRNLAEILLRPMTDDTAIQILQWLKEDIPLFAQLDQSQLNIMSQDIDYDKKRFFIQIGQVIIPLVAPSPNTSQGATFYANAQ